MNSYKVLTLKKNYNFKAKSPKMCAYEFLKKYSKINNEFSVYNPRTNKAYGFYSRKNLLQSGGADITNVYNAVKKMSNQKQTINNENYIQKIVNRNKAYTIVSISLDKSIKDFEEFGDILVKISESLSNNEEIRKYQFLIQDFLKNVIFKLQFVQTEDEFVSLSNILKKFKSDDQRKYIKKTVDKYYNGSTINNTNNIDNIVKKIQTNDILKNKNDKSITAKLSKTTVASTVAPEPTVVPTVAPTVASTVAPTVASTVAPTVGTTEKPNNKLLPFNKNELESIIDNLEKKVFKSREISNENKKLANEFKKFYDSRNFRKNQPLKIKLAELDKFILYEKNGNIIQKRKNNIPIPDVNKEELKKQINEIKKILNTRYLSNKDFDNLLEYIKKHKKIDYIENYLKKHNIILTQEQIEKLKRNNNVNNKYKNYVNHFM